MEWSDAFIPACYLQGEGCLARSAGQLLFIFCVRSSSITVSLAWTGQQSVFFWCKTGLVGLSHQRNQSPARLLGSVLQMHPRLLAHINVPLQLSRIRLHSSPTEGFLGDPEKVTQWQSFKCIYIFIILMLFYMIPTALGLINTLWQVVLTSAMEGRAKCVTKTNA